MTRLRTSATAPSLLAAIRAHFGIGQASLAAYLGVSRALVSLVDINRRELPTAALLRLEPLGRALPPPWSDGAPDPPAPPDPPLPPAPALPNAPDPTALRARLTTAEHELARTRRTLAAAERPAAQGRRLLAILPALAAALPPADARARRQLPYLEAEARDRLGGGATATRALLGARLGALRLEIAWLGEWLRTRDA